MKLTSYALAASLITTPLAAEEPCSVVTQAHGWQIFIVTQTADTVKEKYCIKFQSANADITGIVIKSNDGKGLSVISEEGCMDMKGSDTQTITPLVNTKSAGMLALDTLGFDQAHATYVSLSQQCIAAQIHPPADQIKAPARSPFKDRIYVVDWQL